MKQPKNKKILLFAKDPGGANTIIPLVGPLKCKGYEVTVFGEGVALKKFRQNKIRARSIVKDGSKLSYAQIKDFVFTLKPDFVITGTSANGMTEKYLWRAAEELGIPSFAIIDQWMSYGIRFSRYGVGESDLFAKNPKYEFLPEKILVMDKMAKKEALSEGLPSERIIIAGQPYFEWLKKSKTSRLSLNKLKKSLGIQENDFVVSYASEPVSKDYHALRLSTSHWGYNEITIFKHLYRAIDDAAKATSKNFKLIVKLHPREDDTHYKKILSKLKSDRITVLLNRDSNPWELMKISGLVCGMSSMFLLEAVILKRPTVSIQIGLKKENPFVLDRIGVLKSILDTNRLVGEIKKVVINKNAQKIRFDLIENPVERVINQMEKILWQN